MFELNYVICFGFGSLLQHTKPTNTAHTMYAKILENDRFPWQILIDKK